MANESREARGHIRNEARRSLPQFDRPFRVFAHDGRVLAQNAAGKLIDIGALDRAASAAYTVRLDVDGIETGPHPDEEAALRALVPLLSFDYLDALFTSEADARFDGLLDDLPHVVFTLPETMPREMADGRPRQLF
ncbi:hypothetical protein [Paraburkholderia kururiensis]|uniref:Uncharacterized protein n=1 Tax=Paraburkholderia kururiensis TaxID=984307 RepID=A0ABZ0WSZ5_9BURK|nr:hypothetical protein [Paraburkholderia kururiensis]WQD80517.1 hypothetical protein U0042_13020 [Paraburkholderia kururiensis]